MDTPNTATAVNTTATDEAPVVLPPAKDGQTPAEKVAAKTYSEEEVAKRIEDAKASVKGGYEGTTTQLKAERKAAQERAKALEAELDNVKSTAWLQKVEAAGGDVDAAKQFLTERTQFAQTKRQFDAQKAELEELAKTLNEAGRVKAAHDYVKEYGLDAKAVEELLTANSELEMENKALKLATKKSKQAAPGENPNPAPAKAKGADTSKMSITERLGRAALGEL